VFSDERVGVVLVFDNDKNDNDFLETGKGGNWNFPAGDALYSSPLHMRPKIEFGFTS
jgi:hypothetical protein